MISELSCNKLGVCCPAGVFSELTCFPNACLKSSKSPVSIQALRLQSRFPCAPAEQGNEVGVGVLVAVGITVFVGIVVGVLVSVGRMGVGVLVGVAVGGIGVGVRVGVAVGAATVTLVDTIGLM